MAFKSLTSIRHLLRRNAFSVCARSLMAACIVLAFGMTTKPCAAGVLDAAILGPETKELSLSAFTLVQPDPDKKVTPQSIESSGGRILNGEVSKDAMITLGYEGVQTWLTIKIENKTKQKNWILDFGRRTDGRLGYIESAHAYTMGFTPDGKISVREILPLNDKGNFSLELLPDSQSFILLNIQPAAGKPVILPLKIFSESAYIQKQSSVFSGFAVHSSILLLFAVFFAAMALFHGNRNILPFAAYFLYQLCIWTISETLTPKIGFGIVNGIIPFMLLGFTLFCIFLTKVFFDIEYGSFTEKYVLYGLAWLNIVSTVLLFFLPVDSGFTKVSLFYGAPLLAFIVLGLMAWAQTANGHVAGRYYFAGSLFPVISIIVALLEAFKILPQNAFLSNAPWYAVTFQGAFMAIAMVRKFQTSTHMIPHVHSGNNDVDFSRIQETKDKADHTRLLKVIEKERELLADFRTKEMERVEEMRRAKEEADEANRAKSAFLAVVSHEIRTPMTGVMGMVRLLLDSSITKQQRDYVLTIQESSEAMMALLNDILDFERIQRGKIELENISFDLHRLIQGVITLMSGHADVKGIQISARIDDDLPKFVKGDPTRLRQVLLNLMGNAIKFTEKGGVTLLVKDMSEGNANDKEKKAQIYFAIQDTGIGISAEARRNLFSPFAQADSSISRKFGGTGLGLAISKGLVERMGSSINISSKEGEGSTFFFTLDMAYGTQPATEKPLSRPAEPTRPTKPLRILVVDDNDITRRVVIGFLESGHHAIITASSAEEALDKINTDAFDLILMDIEMPGMSGNEATKVLREHRDRMKAAIPVIAMTGNVAKEDKERYLADGMSGFIGKPIDADQLLSIVEEIAHKTFEREIRMPENHTARQNETHTPVIAQEQGSEPAMAKDKKIFNPDMLQSLKDTIGAKQLEELLNDLITKTEEILQSMDTASKANDLAALAARAHELKGMAGNFGLVEISSIAAQAERKAKSADTGDLGVLVGSLPDASLRAQNALKEWSSH